MSAWIRIIYRIIVAVGKHIIAQDTLAGGDEGIGVEEAALFGGVIAALEVIKFGFSFIVLAIWRKNEDFRTGNTCPYGLPVFPSSGTAKAAPPSPWGRLFARPYGWGFTGFGGRWSPVCLDCWVTDSLSCRGQIR